MKILRVILLVLAALMVSSCYRGSYYHHKPHPMKVLVLSCAMYYDGAFYLHNWEYDNCGTWYNEYWRRPMQWRYPTGQPQHEPFRGVRQPVRLPDTRRPEPRPEARQPEPRRRSEVRQPEARQPEQRRPEARQSAPQRKPESRQAQPRQPERRRT